MTVSGIVVAVLGAESTGKTTLAEALARRLGGAWVPETLRGWCEAQRRTPRRDEQAGIAAEQALRIEAAAAKHRWVVADTTPLQTAVYSEHVFGDRSLYADAIGWHRRLAPRVLLTGLDLPWEADGHQRDGPHVRAPVDRLLREALDRVGLPYALVLGAGEARVEAALRAIEREARSRQAPAEAGDTAAPDDVYGARWRPTCAECLNPACERLTHRQRGSPALRSGPPPH